MEHFGPRTNQQVENDLVGELYDSRTSQQVEDEIIETAHEVAKLPSDSTLPGTSVKKSKIRELLHLSSSPDLLKCPVPKSLTHPDEDRKDVDRRKEFWRGKSFWFKLRATYHYWRSLYQ